MEKKDNIRGRRLPYWMKMQRGSGKKYIQIKNLVKENHLHTICTSGNCPNIGECWNAGHATFMILGEICTRSCKFCGTTSGRPLPPDPLEPERLAHSVKKLNLNHCVVTSVDRDDLSDGGAEIWARSIMEVKRINPEVTIEALIPDFDGIQKNIQKVIDAKPEIISHNLETIQRLTPVIRSRAKYECSLDVLKYLASMGVVTKSGIMVGLGETEEEVFETMDDLRSSGCRIMTLGQYLRPSLSHMEVKEYISPEKFEQFKNVGLDKGFDFVESGPQVRTSYHADRHLKIIKQKK